MRTNVRAALATAAVLALAACGPQVHTGQQGPFSMTCVIAPKGVALVTTINNGGRKQKLGSFVIRLTTGKGHPLRSRHITVKPPATVNPTGLLVTHQIVLHEPVTYRAASCKAVQPRP